MTRAEQRLAELTSLTKRDCDKCGQEKKFHRRLVGRDLCRGCYLALKHVEPDDVRGWIDA